MRGVALVAAVLTVGGVVVVAGAGAGCHRQPRVGGVGTRALEARLGADDRWRPLAPGRGALSLDEQAALERRGAWQALADAELAAGRLDAAAATLDRAPPSPSVDGDRAVVLLLRGDLEGALDRLSTLAARTPGSGVALWNRALALRALGLPRNAAAAFDAVAALGEPGWSGEARAQAAALRERLDANQRQWKEAKSAGKALIDSGAPPPATVLQRFPSYMRHFLYHALRAAPTPERVRSLAPLAATLDARQGGEVLATLVARTAARDLRARAPLAATYARLASNPAALDKAAAEAYLAALRRAHEDDLLLGALILLQRNGDEMIELARATNDPWYRALAADAEAQALAAHDQLAQAESLVLPALDECRAHQLDYRCVHLEARLVDIYRLQHRNDDAQRLGMLALGHAHEHARSPLDVEFELLMRLGDSAREREGFALMQAFLDEGLRANPDSCEGRRWAWDMIAAAHLFRFDAAGARAALDRSPRCQQPITIRRANVVVELTRLGFGGDDAKTLLADLAEARKTLAGGARAWADALTARFVASHDRAAAAPLFARALAAAEAAPHDVEARKARAFVQLTRAVSAALADDPGAALAALAADVGAPPPTHCALGVAVDSERAIAVARDAEGAAHAVVERHRSSPALDAAALVPAPMRAALAGCSEVAVFAPPPVHGLPELLPPELAWSYRLRATPLPLARAPRPHRVVVTNPTPPPSLSLPPLADWRADAADIATLVLEGAAATPARVLAAIGDATELEIHAHGLLDLGLSDASVLALSPDASGHFALSARDLARASLRARPLVILAACRAGQAAAYRHEPFGLPLGFVQAGAAAVYASPAPIGDADAAPFFAAVLAKIRDGRSPARALRDERVRVLARDAGHWVRQLVVFQ